MTRTENRRRLFRILAACFACTMLVGAAVEAQEMMVTEETMSAEEILAFWTPERMAEAVPMEMPLVETGIAVDRTLEPLPEGAVPGFTPGWRPGSGPQPEAGEYYEVHPGHPMYETATGSFQPQTYGTAPSNPESGPYGPFQRWTWYGAYKTFPTSVVGKLFFIRNGGSFVCSAAVISRSAIFTAGHCLHDGVGVFSNSLMFCPSYNKRDGINPSVGCWGVVQQTVPTVWASAGNIDWDYGCAVMNTTGSVVSNKIGNVTGWAGFAWNFASQQPIVAYGYPQASPFPGYHIIATSAPEWYEVDMVSGDQKSKYIGNDMTPGSSGGPWFLSIRHPNGTFEYPDTDGSDATDPVQGGGPYLNGINSHKRCINGCGTPPTPTAGVFWQEMGSPQFRATAAGAEAKDLYDICSGHPNNDP